MKLRTISKVIQKYGKNLKVNKNINFPFKITLKRNKYTFKSYQPEHNIEM